MAEPEFKIIPSTISPNLVPIGLNDSEYMSEVGLAVGATPATNTPATPIADPNIIPAGGGSIVRGFLKSQNGNWGINGDGSVDFKDGNFRGDITGASGTFGGTITATTGSIGGWSISANAIYFDGATDALSAGLAPADYPFYAGKKYADRSTAPFRVTPDGAFVTSNITITGLQAGSSLDLQYALANSIGSAAANLALQSWTINCAFSSTDLNTVSWGSGVITLADGETFSIDAGNTGNMSARTYIYLDIGVSETVLQTTTTPATAVGNGKKLIATAVNDTATATFQVFGGVGGLFINGDVIAANSIVANQINTSTLSAIAADLGTITAGNITLDSAGYIKGGQTAYNTGTGFWLGYDTDAYKFSLGDPAGSHLRWDGTKLWATNMGVVKYYTAARDVTEGKGVYLLGDGKVAHSFGDATYDAVNLGALNFIGFAMETTSAGSSAPIKLTEVADIGLSGLTIGSTYYVKNTALSATETITQTEQDGTVNFTSTHTQTFKPLKTLLTSVVIRLTSSAVRLVRCNIIRGADIIGSAEVAAQYSGTGENVTFTYSSPIDVIPGEELTLNIYGSSSSSVSMYYNSADVYADGVFSEGGDAYFKVNEKEGDGVIDTSAGAVSKKVGIATAADEILILNS